MKTLIALAGEMGSGKGTVIKLLESIAGESRLGKVSTSGFLRTALEPWGLPPTRENLQLLPQVMKQAFGPDTFFDALAYQINELGQDIVIFDGPRFIADIDYLKARYNLILVYVTADQKTRYQRTLDRGEKQGESQTSFEKFLEQHQAPTEIEIPLLKPRAIAVIQNDASLEELEKLVKNFYEKLVPSR